MKTDRFKSNISVNPYFKMNNSDNLLNYHLFKSFRKYSNTEILNINNTVLSYFMRSNRDLVFLLRKY